MRLSITLLTLAAAAALANAQTPLTPPMMNWDSADVAVIYAADQEKYPDVFRDSQGNPANSFIAPVWGQKCVFSDDECGDGAAIRIDNLDFLPLQALATIDLSDYRYLHLDMWAQNDDQLNLSLQNWWPGEKFTSEIWNLKGGEWLSVDIDMDSDNFTWSKKNEIPQHCVNVFQFGGGTLSNDFPHSEKIYVTNLIAHNDLSANGGNGVNSVVVSVAKPGIAYNLFGQRVKDDYKGIVIINGIKILRK